MRKAAEIILSIIIILLVISMVWNLLNYTEYSRSKIDEYEHTISSLNIQAKNDSIRFDSLLSNRDTIKVKLLKKEIVWKERLVYVQSLPPDSIIKRFGKDSTVLKYDSSVITSYNNVREAVIKFYELDNAKEKIVAQNSLISVQDSAISQAKILDSTRMKQIIAERNISGIYKSELKKQKKKTVLAILSTIAATVIMIIK